MANDDDCHDDIEINAVKLNAKVYIGEYTEKSIMADGLFAEDDLTSECQPRDNLVFGVLDKDGMREDKSFNIIPTRKDDIRRKYFPAKFTAPDEDEDNGVVKNMKRGIFIKREKDKIENGKCVPYDGRAGTCHILHDAITFAKRDDE